MRYVKYTYASRLRSSIVDLPLSKSGIIPGYELFLHFFSSFSYFLLFPFLFIFLQVFRRREKNVKSYLKKEEEEEELTTTRMTTTTTPLIRDYIFVKTKTGRTNFLFLLKRNQHGDRV